MLNPVPVISCLDPNGLKRYLQFIVLVGYVIFWFWLRELHAVFHFLYVVYGITAMSCLDQEEYEQYTRHIIYGIGCCGVMWMYSGAISLIMVNPMAALMLVLILSPHLLLLTNRRKGEKVQLLSAVTALAILFIFYILVVFID